MALPEFSLRQLLEAGVHFGHQSEYWNPKMERYIYGQRNGIHIIDLTQTFSLLHKALEAVHEVASRNGRILFVGTKRQAQAHIAEAAERSAQYFMNHRWLGGTLTNWKTISNSIRHLKNIEEREAQGLEGLTKKERLNLERERNKLQASLGGIREMGTLPDIVFVVDVKKENLAVLEARKCGIPVVGVVDTNCSPEGIDYIIPGNDDAGRAIELYCDLVTRTIIDAMSKQMSGSEEDVSALIEEAEAVAAAEAAAEPAPAEEATPEPAPATEPEATVEPEAEAKPAPKARKAKEKKPTKDDAPAAEDG